MIAAGEYRITAAAEAQQTNTLSCIRTQQEQRTLWPEC